MTEKSCADAEVEFNALGFRMKWLRDLATPFSDNGAKTMSGKLDLPMRPHTQGSDMALPGSMRSYEIPGGMPPSAPDVLVAFVPSRRSSAKQAPACP